MKLFITNLPAFYKTNLYNEIQKHIDILVVYTGLDGETRNIDFLRGDMTYNHILLRGSFLTKILMLIRILSTTEYEEMVIGGWDSIYSWLGAFLSKKKKNSIVVESSIKESQLNGIKGWLKKLFLKRINKAYVSGTPHKRLLTALAYKGQTIITYGVGIFNICEQPPYYPRKSVHNFLYVGRLVKVKNLLWLIEQFNRHNELHLDIVGYGEEEKSLKRIANNNICFIGAVDNQSLPHYYQNADVFILPSLSETWGLVVEEALNNGCPVMVSEHVGCSEDVVNSQNGVVFALNEDDFDDKLKRITELGKYNEMRQYVSRMDVRKSIEKQINCYIS